MTVYFDMDGVLADFFGGIEKHFHVDHWKAIDNVEKALDNLKGTDFFYQIKPFDTTSKLIGFVRDLGDDWGICSSPLRGDHYNSAYWKRRWLEKYGWEPVKSQNIVFTANKHKYAVSPIDGTPNVLIDDKPSNIARWIEAGGIGIRYQANQDDLDEYLLPLLEANYR